MSTEKTEARKSRPQPIPVAQLMLDEHHHVNVPGMPAFSSSQAFVAGDSVLIEFLPWVRHHCITTHPGTPNEKKVMVPEAWCSWVQGGSGE